MYSGYVDCDRKQPHRLLSPQSSAVGCGRSLCLVSVFDENGGSHALASSFVADGWRVTFLDLAPGKRDSKIEKSYLLESLSGVYRERYWYTPLQSLAAYHWLKNRAFDAIVFQEGFGAGYYSCIARDLGIAFQGVPIFIFPYRPHAQQLESTKLFPTGRTDLERDCLERETVARADCVVANDEETFLWMARAGWTFPLQSACFSRDGDLPWGKWLLSAMKTESLPHRTSSGIYISVCLATYNRPEELRAAIGSLVLQTVYDFELIVVDDGSTNPAVEGLHAELGPLFKKRGWRWVRQRNGGPSLARNEAAEIARGTHLLFMDDDNLALPDELECFANAAATGIDILTCISGYHRDSAFGLPPIMHLPSREAVGGADLAVTWIPSGAHLMLAMFTNPFGDTNALYRRDVFRTLGGFKGSREMVFEDFEFFSRAVIAGFRLEVIPEVLFLYRRHESSRSMGQTIFTSHIDSLKPIANLLPPSLRPLLLAMRQEFYSRHRALISGQAPENR